MELKMGKHIHIVNPKNSFWKMWKNTMTSPQVCRVQTIGVAFMTLARIFMFMRSRLQHEISAGRFLSLWGLSLVPPPIPLGRRSNIFLQTFTAGVRTGVV